MRRNFPGTRKDDEIKGTNKDDTIHGLAGNDKLNGRGGDDKIFGDDGRDKLDGREGHDILTGGAGRDDFRFKELGAEHSDQIKDFRHGVDRIGLSVFVFDELGIGTLGTDNFVTNTAAQDADDFLIFDAETRNLYYDADGNGAGEQVLLAHIKLKGPVEERVLTADDIFIFQPENEPT